MEKDEIILHLERQFFYMCVKRPLSQRNSTGCFDQTTDSIFLYERRSSKLKQQSEEIKSQKCVETKN